MKMPFFSIVLTFGGCMDKGIKETAVVNYDRLPVKVYRYNIKNAVC